jgi:3-deoxy-7-phosphoheptulonate synthase
MDERPDVTNAQGHEPLPSPDALKARLPVPPEAAATVGAARRAIREALHGRDPTRLVVVVGPCSIHDPGAALGYAARLRPLADAHCDALIVVMRTYFEKPRTTVGWRGFLSDPRLEGREDVLEGLAGARELLRALNALGVPCASELLDPGIPPYLADLLAWAAIGARTVESQPHRALASGLDLPIGFKNGTDGSIETAVNGMTAARHPHRFVGFDAAGRACVVKTRGNPDRHLVLRGGRGGPNYAPADVERAARLASAEGVARPVMVDCSHDNSAKDHTRQGAVCRAVLEQVRAGERSIVGLLLESHLEAGRQDWRPGLALRRGVSITDACIGFAETEALLEEAASAVHTARAARACA